MLSAALCTVIKDHLQSFIISCSLSVSLSGPTCLSIHLSASLAVSLLSCLLFILSISHLHPILTHFFVFFLVTFFPTVVCSPFPSCFTPVLSRFRHKLSYPNGNMYRTFVERQPAAMGSLDSCFSSDKNLLLPMFEFTQI